MKQIIFTFLALFLGLGFTSAQNVNEKETSMSLGKHTAFVMEIDGADEDIVEDVWKKFIKDFGKGKRNKKAKEYYSIGAQVPTIAGSEKIDLYAKFDERVGLTSVYLWVDMGAGFINSDENPSESQGAEEFLEKFYLEVKNKAITEEMKDQEKVLKKMDKELRKLEKNNKGYHNDIEKAKERIEKAEKNIEQNLKDQEDQRILIEQQKKVIEEIVARLNNLGKD